MTISKTDLVTQIAAAADLKKAEAERAVVAIFAAIANGLMQRSPVHILGFGTFRVAHRAAAKGRNPATGEEIQIAAKNTAKFVPSAALKLALNPQPSVPRRRQA